MNYLGLPPTEGVIANTVKERILTRMYEGRQGYLSAAKACGVSTQRAHAELKADKTFAANVATAREGIAEYLAEELIDLADQATEVTANAVALKVKTRQWILEKVIPRFRPVKAESGGNLTFNDNRTLVISDEDRRRLQDKLKEYQQSLT